MHGRVCAGVVPSQTFAFVNTQISRSKDLAVQFLSHTSKSGVQVSKGTITHFSFNRKNLQAELGNDQSAKYLYNYLSKLGAHSMVVESHYVDRHYLDDFSGCYSKNFNTPPAHTRRLHFFHTPRKVTEEYFRYAYLGQRKKSQAALQQVYLGFVVNRPLSNARIGRSVLQTFPVEGRRRFPCSLPYKVYLVGLELEVRGLAYQEQDGGVAVCASTALWSAMQQVSYVAGNWAPTPTEVTNAAASPYPANYGLSDDQMATAVSRLGYLVDYFESTPNPSLFRAKVVSYLKSHLPVVLLMTRRTAAGAGEVQEGHAITTTGYNRLGRPQPVNVGEATIPLKAASLEVIYVHDDNFGSHAHYELFERPTDPKDECLPETRQMLRRGHAQVGAEFDWWEVDEWVVEGALVAKPNEWRMPVDEIFLDLLYLQRQFDLLFKGLNLHFEVRFDRGVAYTRQLFDMALNHKHLQQFLAGLTCHVLSGSSAPDTKINACWMWLSTPASSKRILSNRIYWGSSHPAYPQDHRYPSI